MTLVTEQGRGAAGMNFAKAAGTVTQKAMERGRLIRVAKYRGDPSTVSYIVALPDAGTAIDLMREKVGGQGDAFEDLCRVSDDLLKALNLQSGGYIRVDKPRSHTV
jgi:hypothetical protein